MTNLPVNRVLTVHETAGLLADADYDGDVDLSDFARLQRCVTGYPIDGADDPCHLYDANGDGAIDAADHAHFMAHLGGPLHR